MPFGLQAIREGVHNIIIGTQSLISKNTSFHRLGLVVIDEQHRFGVKQRAMLTEKVRGRVTHSG